MKIETIDEYKEWKLRQQRLPLAELIAKPNCGCDCPKEAPFSCGCDECGENKGYLVAGEKEKRAELLNLTDAEIELWDTLWDNVRGYLTETGCGLLRKMRSEKCLRAICGKQETLRGILSGVR